VKTGLESENLESLTNEKLMLLEVIVQKILKKLEKELDQLYWI